MPPAEAIRKLNNCSQSERLLKAGAPLFCQEYVNGMRFPQYIMEG